MKCCLTDALHSGTVRNISKEAFECVLGSVSSRAFGLHLRLDVLYIQGRQPLTLCICEALQPHDNVLHNDTVQVLLCAMNVGPRTKGYGGLQHESPRQLENGMHLAARLSEEP